MMDKDFLDGCMRIVSILRDAPISSSGDVLIKGYIANKAADIIDRVTAENEKFRAALENIERRTDGYYRGAAGHTQRIAYEALKQQEGKRHD